MLSLTVNTDILMIASGVSDKDLKKGRLYQACASLTQWLSTTDNAKIVLDHTGKIQAEYSILPEGSVGQQFFKEMLANGRTEFVHRHKGKEWGKLFKKLGLHKSDAEFVRAAMMSRDKIIVAEESDFHSREPAIRGYADVSVDRAADAIARTKTLAAPSTDA